MRVQSLKSSHRALTRSAALILVGGLAAGCSSGVSRFTTDGLFTGSTSNQRNIIRNDNQPYPADVARPQAATGQYESSPARTAVQAPPVSAPVQRASLPPPTSTPAAPARPEKVAVAPAPKLDRTPTGTVKSAPEKPAVEKVATEKPRGPAQDGWSAEGGRLVTLKDGESLGTLSDRYGVPVKAIVNANGFADANSVRSGQKVIIPVYSYARKPDAQKPVKEANAAPADKQPAPAKKPENVAVLPQQPKLQEQDAKVETASSGVAPAQPKAEKGVYTVASGDSLYGIAKKTGTTADAIRKANGLDKSTPLKIGQKLKVPAASTEVAAAPQKVDPTVTGTTTPAKVKTEAEPAGEKAKLATYTPPKRDDSAIKAAAAASDEEAPDSTGIGKMRWPVRGRVVSAYASGGDGIDIAVPEGTPVKAAENGVVIFAGEGLKDFGKTVLVRHADGKVTVYGHTGEIKVNRGDTVRRGQEIAKSGMSGNTDTPKLHFEVRENSSPVDPQKYLE